MTLRDRAEPNNRSDESWRILSAIHSSTLGGPLHDDRPTGETAVDLTASTSTRYPASDRWFARGQLSDARAMTRPDILAPDASGHTAYPRYVERASGPYVWDVDGHRYIDFLLGYGPVVLGHADERVTHAVVSELTRAVCVAPLWSRRQVELTELLTAVIPGAERALLLKTGSDATSAAVRLARIYTGRDLVTRWGYNGWHDWSVEQAAGVPRAVRSATLHFDYHDLDGLSRLFDRHPDSIACVLMVPYGDGTAPAGHLRAIRDLCHRNGALFVLDEMRSGFRLALGGAQAALGVTADLATFSKAMANGYPISAVTGGAAIMSELSKTKISSTFFANPAEMVAALRTIEILRDTPALDHIAAMGTLLQQGLRDVFVTAGVPASVVGYPSMPFVEFAFDDDTDTEIYTNALFRATTENGILLHPSHQWFVSAAHTPSDIEFAVNAVRAASKIAGAALEVHSRGR